MSSSLQNHPHPIAPTSGRHSVLAPSSPPPPSPSPFHASYAQATRAPKGPGFIRSHARDVESFARLPRTGVNIICGSHDGIPSFSFANSDLRKVEDLFSKALVMKFLGGRPSLESSHSEIISWGIAHPFSIGPLSSRAFLLRFQDDSDLLKVLSRPASSLLNFPYKVFRWHNLCHVAGDSCFALVWITLPKLPIQCFVPEFLESVANKIGCFLCLDTATATLARPSAARLCVEINLRAPPPKSIWVGLFDGFEQHILYDRLPKFCSSCLSQGHTSEACSKGPSVVSNSLSPHRLLVSFQGTPTARSNAPPSQSDSSSLAQPFVNPTTTSSPFPSAAPPQGPSTPKAPVHPHASRSADIPYPLSPTVAPPVDRPSSSNLPSIPLANLIVPTGSLLPSPKHSRRFAPYHLRKSVAITPAQSNVEANQAFWEAVNRQLAINERARIVHPPIASAPSPCSPRGDLESPVPADPSPVSPVSSFKDSQNPYDVLRSTAYDSVGEAPTRDPSPPLRPQSDDMLPDGHCRPKKNKRLPDQPLRVNLRARKDPYPRRSARRQGDTG